ncbi:hypothetical protein ACB092_07G033900 [Castanea dentata]
MVALWVNIIPLELKAACILMLEYEMVGLLGWGRKDFHSISARNNQLHQVLKLMRMVPQDWLVSL